MPNRVKKVFLSVTVALRASREGYHSIPSIYNIICVNASASKPFCIVIRKGAKHVHLIAPPPPRGEK